MRWVAHPADAASSPGGRGKDPQPLRSSRRRPGPGPVQRSARLASWSGAGTHVYVLGPNPDERLIWVDGAGTVRYPHTDRRGSTIAVSQAGQAVERFHYGEFGQSGPTITGYPYRYTGQRLDAWTGHYNYKAREYAPSIGRFLQPDPLGFVDGPNVYAYVGNDPLNASDPTGEVRWLIRMVNGGLRTVQRDQAERALRRGADVRAEGPGASRQARGLARSVWGRRTTRHDAHAEGQRPHYQHRNGGRGHVFYGAAAAVSDAASGAADSVQAAVEAVGMAGDATSEAARPGLLTEIVGSNPVTQAIDDWVNPLGTMQAAGDLARTAADVANGAIDEVRTQEACDERTRC